VQQIYEGYTAELDLWGIFSIPINNSCLFKDVLTVFDEDDVHCPLLAFLFWELFCI